MIVALVFQNNHKVILHDFAIRSQSLVFQDHSRVPRAWTFVHGQMRYNRQKQAIGDETDDTFVKPQAVDDIPIVWSQGRL